MCVIFQLEHPCGKMGILITLLSNLRNLGASEVLSNSLLPLQLFGVILLCDILEARVMIYFHTCHINGL